MACLLILLTLSFAEQKFFILMKSSLPTISFIDQASALYLKSYHHTQGHLGFLLTLSSRCFIILHFTLRSMIHFKLTFIKGVSSVSGFICLHIIVQLFRHHLWKMLSLLRCIALALLSEVS